MKEKQNIIVNNLTDRQLALMLANQTCNGYLSDVIKVAEYYYDWLTEKEIT